MKSIFEKVREFQKQCWDIDKQSDDYKNDIANWERIYITRKLSIWFTYIIRNSRITPNQVTALWVILGIAGTCLLIPNNYSISVMAIIFLYISWILDDVDGDLARYKKQFSIEGNFIDMLGHQLIFPMIFCCLTVSMVSKGEEKLFIILGLIAATLVTPLTKMHDNVLLLTALKEIGENDQKTVEPPEARVDAQSSSAPMKANLSISKLISMIFTHFAMLYLLIVSVIFCWQKFYVAFSNMLFISFALLSLFM